MDGRTKPRSNAPQAALLPRHVKHALDYMHSNLGEKITLAALSTACAVSERTLLKQFEKFVGQSPLAWLRRLRLNMARNRLLKPDCHDAIADIAIGCGFSHLGRFATEYRRVFGEAPSATRRRIGARREGGLAGNGESPLTPSLERDKPGLLILPLFGETLQENIEARALTERLAAILTRMRIVSVRLTRQSHAYSMAAPCPRNAGSRYGLLGRLTQRGERLRVITRLVDIAADRHIWGDCFDGSVNDLFELQDRVVEGVLYGVVAHITDAEIERTRNRDPSDLGARDLALRALSHILKANAVDAQKAIAVLEGAVAMDFSDAVAAALLAYCQIELVNRCAAASPAGHIEAAARLSQRAGLLGSNEPLALVARAGVAGWLQQYDEAEALLARAIAIDPTSAWAWERYAYSRLSHLPMGVRDPNGTPQHPHISPANHADRAIADFQRALQLRGPGLPRSTCLHGIGSAHCMAGRWEDARLWLHRALAENPDGTWIHRNLSCLAFKMGDHGGMAQSVDHVRRTHPYLTVSYHADHFPADPRWLEALANAGMPLT